MPEVLLVVILQRTIRATVSAVDPLIDVWRDKFGPLLFVGRSFLLFLFLSALDGLFLPLVAALLFRGGRTFNTQITHNQSTHSNIVLYQHSVMRLPHYNDTN